MAVLRHAVSQGLDGRIGLEDVLELPDGSPALDNASLVAAARILIERGGDQVSSDQVVPRPDTH